MSQPPTSILGATLLASVGGGETLASVVAQRLAEAISMGLIADGEQLPPESELAAQLAISTVSLRAALAILRQEGVLETRRGRSGGSFIRAPSDYSPSKSIQRLGNMSPSQVRDLGYELEAITGVAASLAAQRFDGDNIARLKGLAEQLAEAGAPLERLRLYSRFHIEIAVASQSERLTRRMVVLQAEYSELLWLPAAGVDHVSSAQRHIELVKAIEAGDAELARRLAEAYVTDNTRRIVELRLGMDE